MNKPMLWLGAAASISTIGAFVSHLLQSRPANPPLNSDKSNINNNQGINFGTIEQRIEVKSDPVPDDDDPVVETIREPIVKTNNKGAIVALSSIINDLSPYSNNEYCLSGAKLSGTIVSRQYDPRHKTRIESLVLVDSREKRFVVDIDPSLGLRLPRVYSSQLQDFLSERQRIRLTGCSCGQGAGVFHADAISIR